jgi:hypothetical protein
VYRSTLPLQDEFVIGVRAIWTISMPKSH